MDRRFEWRFDEMMEQAEVSPELLKDLLPRMRFFLEPIRFIRRKRAAG